MKNLCLVGLVAIVVVVGTAWGRTQARVEAQGRLPPFRITLHTSATGFVAECAEGCAWSKQTFSCAKDAATCDAQITESSIGPAR